MAMLVFGAVATYTPDGDAIAGDAGGRFNNRPLYGPRNGALVLAGDAALVRFGVGARIFTTFLVGVARKNVSVWLHELRGRVRYRGGVVSWSFADPRFPAVELRAVPLGAGKGRPRPCKLAGMALACAAARWLPSPQPEPWPYKPLSRRMCYGL